MLGEYRAVFAGQHEDVLFAARAAKADLDLGTRDDGKGLAQLALDILLGGARTLAAWRQVQRQGRLAHLGSTARHERVAVRGATANGRVNHLHMGVGIDDRPGLLGDGHRFGEGRAGRQGDADLRLREVVGRQEAGRQQRHQRERPEEEYRGGHQRHQPVAQAPGGPAFVADQPTGRCLVGHRLEQVGRHHRRQQAGDDEREEDGDRRGPPELDEEFAGDAAHEGGRQEHGDQREGGGDHRQADLVGRLHRRLVGRLAHAQVAHDVLDLDDGVIDQDAHHQRQRQRGDDVEGEAHQVHHGEGRDRRQRQGRGRDEGRPPVAQEEPDDDDGEDGALDQQCHRSLVVFNDRVDEVEGLGNRDVGMLGFQSFEGLAHRVGYLDLAGTPTARDLEADDRPAVEQRCRARLADRVGNRRHLVEADAAAVGEDDVHRRQFLGRLHGGDGAHRLLDATDIGAAARCFLLDAAQLAGNVGGGGIERQQAGRVEFDADLAGDTADAGDSADAAYGEHGLRHGVVDKPGERLVVHALRGHGVGQDRRPGDADAADDRVAQVARQVRTDARDGVADVIDRLLHRLLEAELDGDRGRAVLHLGVDVLDALHGGDGVLDLARHLGFHLCRRGPRQRGGDGDRRQVDVHELLDFHRPEGEDAGQREQDEEENRRNRVPDRPGGKVHFAAAATTRTGSPSARKPPPVATTRACGSSPETISMRSPRRRPVATLAWATRAWSPSPSRRNT